MQQTLEDFFKVVRSAGVNISVADSIETSKTVELVGYGDRGILRDALALSLAKTTEEKEKLYECFEQFFAFDAFQNTSLLKPQPGPTDKTEQQAGQPPAGEQQAVEQEQAPAEYKGDLELAKMLFRNDKAELAQTMKKAARKANITDIWLFTQKGINTQKIMNEMGLRELNKEITSLGKGDCPAERALSGQLRTGQKYLFQEVRNFVEQQLSMFGKTASQTIHEEFLKSSRLSNIEKRDFEVMVKIVQKMAKRLSSMHSKKRKRKDRGQLDFRKTLRSNVAFDGVMFNIFWKSKEVDKPRILALCDISPSVSSYSRFLLLFLYSLSDVLDRIDTCVFTNSLIEVNDIFDQYPVQQAVEKITNDFGMGGSDYGNTLLDLKNDYMDKVDNKTTVIILGDARNNNLAPQTEVMKLLYQRAKRVIWLTPEMESFWGTGDSEMLKYKAYCNIVKECNTITHLEQMVDTILKVSAQTA
ncbi:MAG: VWA domain-containing protein [Cycloclasticus sp.]